MTDFWETIGELYEKHWQGGIYQWIFYAGVLLVLILERRKMARIVFGWIPVAFHLCIFNPLFMSAMELAGAGDSQYFVRMFSFMPLMYTIARGFMCILEKTKGWIKFILVCAACTLFILTGTMIYEQSWFVKAENSAKISAETYELIDIMEQGEGQDVRIAAADPIAKYIRQEKDYITPYARWTGELGTQLAMDPPDVDTVMKSAGKEDMDYILTGSSSKIYDAFYDHGYEPYDLTYDHVIYQVSGVPRVRRIFDEKRQVRAVTNYNEDGEVVPFPGGYTTVTYDYDDHRYCIREAYLDENGELYQTAGGYASINRKYSSRGLLKSIAYVDTEGNPILYQGRYETKYEYDLTGKVTRVSYYDANGLPMNREDGFAEAKWNYNQATHSFDMILYTDMGEKISMDGINLARGIPGDNENWSEWIYPRKDAENSTINIGYVNLGEKQEGDEYTCQIEIEFKGIQATKGKEFRFYTQGAADGSWHIGNVWNKGFINLDTPPRDGIYTFTATRTVSESMVGVSTFDLGFRCDYWKTGGYRVRRIKIEKGNKATLWTPGI